MKEQELIKAVKTGNYNDIQKLIEEGVNINCTDDDKSSFGFTWTPLHYGIFKATTKQEAKYADIIKTLLNNGAAIESVNFTGETPVLFAVKVFALNILDILIKNGANIHAVNNKGQNIFDVILDRYYYDQRLDEEHIDDEKNETAKKAIKKGEGESLKRMFRRIDAVVNNGYDLNTGKHSAAFCAILEISENKLPSKVLLYLFDKGANPRECVKSPKGDLFPIFDQACHRKVPLETLVEMAKKVGIEYAFEQFVNYNPLLIAVRNNNMDLVKRLVALGADIHSQNERPLRVACSVGNLEIVKYFVENNAKIDIVDQKGNSPIFYAKSGGFKKIVNYLNSKMKK